MRSRASHTVFHGSRLLTAGLLLFGCALSAVAFSFEPISQDYTTSGPGANHVFRVNNTTDERIAVQISVVPRRFEVDGTEVQGEEASEFIVFPRQLLLEPGQRRSVRVRWAGPEEIEAERAYRIIAAQVPVDLGTDAPVQGGGLRLIYRYEGSLYVVPDGARASVSAESVAVVTAESGEMLSVRLVNNGTRHTLLTGARLLLRSEPGGDPRIVMGPEELPGLAGENMLAETVREFVVPAPRGLWSGPVYAEIEIDAE